ncbi:MAG: sigma-70 family RNA polymerase sigma factor [Pirellulaceae bacterium]
METGSDTSLSLLLQIRHAVQPDDAWSAFVNRYGSRIYQWCLNRNLQPTDAEDVSQTVLLKLAKALRNFEYDNAGSFRGWLRRVTENALIDFFREQQRSMSVAANSIEPLSHVEARNDLIQRLESAFDLELLEKAIARVRERVNANRFKAWELAAVHRLPATEIATKLQMKIASVYTARNQVQRLIQQETQALEKELDQQ